MPSDKVKKLSDAELAAGQARGAKICVIMTIILTTVGYFLQLWPVVLTSAGMQLGVFFLHGLPFNSEKFFDLSGSFTHLAVVLSSLVFETKVRTPRQILVAVASVVWMTRLGTFLYNRILRDGKDGRFDAIKQVFLRWIGIWMFQATWVTLIQLPVVLLNSIDDSSLGGDGITLLDGVGLGVWLFGFLFEAVADSQKMVFRSDASNRHGYITTGLWRYSRHPNYFGEILMWIGLSIVASGVAMGGQAGIARLHFAWISPVFTTLLLAFVSGVPLVEKAGQEKWGKDPKYTKYMKETSCIVPWFPSKQA